MNNDERDKDNKENILFAIQHKIAIHITLKKKEESDNPEFLNGPSKEFDDEKFEIDDFKKGKKLIKFSDVYAVDNYAPKNKEVKNAKI